MSKTPPTFPVLAYLDERVESLRELVPRAIKEWEPAAIHEVRVTTRRMRAAMVLLEPVLTADHRRPFERVLKKLRQRLGPLRDLDVMIGNLEPLRRGQTLAAAGWLRAGLAAERDRQRQRLGRRASSARVLAKLGSWWGVRQELAESKAAITSLIGESVHLQIDAFAERAADAAQAAASIQLAGDEPLPAGVTIAFDSQHVQPVGDAAEQHDPHALRIAGKALRYTLELAEVHGIKLPAAVRQTFRQMQDSLGAWHDDVVLCEQAMRLSLDGMLGYHDPSLAAEVLHLSRLLLRRAQRHLGRFHALWQSRGEELSSTIRRAFPLTRQSLLGQPAVGASSEVSESKTVPDPADSAISTTAETPGGVDPAAG